MSLTPDHLLDIQRSLIGSTATAEQITEEGGRIVQRHRALEESFYALKARLDEATFRAGAEGHENAEVVAARADLHGIGGRIVQEMLREEAKLKVLNDRCSSNEAGIAEAAFLLDREAPQERGAFHFVKLLLVVLTLAELAGVPVIDTIKRSLGG